ncbi:MAG: aminoacyl-tRNA hydrolase [Treponema sp.]|nr:aminoacyl-tRNA hydrolase [Treponema sp.]
MIQLIAFLGNPGHEYAGNRHNAGRLLVESLPFASSLSWQKKFQGLYTAVAAEKITANIQTLSAPHTSTPTPHSPLPTPNLPPKYHFLMPETYMNNSGESVSQAATFFKIKPEEIIIVHDELEIPLGSISLKYSGGLGGHNGLRSMKACLGTADFWRLRIGIGRPDNDDVYNWVLSDFSVNEKETLNTVLDASAALLMQCLNREPDTLLPEWAKKKIVKQE